jgi:hypothetical protein
MDSGLCGGDWDRFEEVMTFRRINALREAWNKLPPLTLVSAWRFKLGDNRPTGKSMPNMIELLERSGQKTIGG